MVRLQLTLAYTGTFYAGWQIQSERQAQPTIQQKLEEAVAAVVGFPVRIHGAGRTDAGVHAEEQVAHVDVPETPTINWQCALNTKLPHDIRVLNVRIVPAEFHSRFSATGKLYAYTTYASNGVIPPRLYPFVWATPPLDHAAMEAAAALLVGRHDFASFQNRGTPLSDTVRTVWSIRRKDGWAGSFSCPPGWPVATWFFHGDGFLKQMVRNLMGLLVWVGQGKASAADVVGMLAARNRQATPSPTAPGKGLTLMRVEFPDTF